jgi:GTPase Era involved in 16S rRNA processing
MQRVRQIYYYFLRMFTVKTLETSAFSTSKNSNINLCFSLGDLGNHGCRLSRMDTQNVLVVVNKIDLYSQKGARIPKAKYKDVDRPEQLQPGSSNMESIKEFLAFCGKSVVDDVETQTVPVSLSELQKKWNAIVPKADILAVSALTGQGIDDLKKKLVSMMPLGPKYFPADQITTKNERFFCAEAIRESLLELYKVCVIFSLQFI